ncbi:MAG: hypothetical protein ACNYZG_10415, partial [Gammaproteobacteria bacterium]
SIVILFIVVGIAQTATALERTRLGLVKEGEFSLLTGLEYQEGDYGTPESTSLLRIPISITYRKTNFSLYASMPILFASSDGDIITSSKTSMPKTTESVSPSGKGQQTVAGIGDMVLSASYYFTADLRHETSYRLTAGLKLGTADESEGLGTGEDDLFIEGGAVKNIDEYMLSGTLGYEINGDSPVFNYNDVVYGTVGLTKQLAMNKQIGSLLYFSQALTDVSDAPLELSVFYSQPVAKTRAAYFYLSKGLSNGSPDFSLGGTIQFYY